MYKILGADRKEYGPVSAEVLRQWIAERRANGQTLVQPAGGTDWKPLASLPEFANAFGAGGAPGAVAAGPTPLTPGAPAVPPSQGLAITSLVFGILGLLCLGLFAGIPAIIMGHLAHGRARREPERYGGSGLAIAGFAMGYASILMTAILAGMLLPALAKAKTKATSINCINNLKQVGLAARIYANDNKDVLPRDFLTMSNELATPKILCCPSDTGKTRAENWESVTARNISYEIVSPGVKEEPANMSRPYARCPIHNHTVLVDGSVQSGDRGRDPRRF